MVLGSEGWVTKEWCENGGASTDARAWRMRGKRAAGR